MDVDSIQLTVSLKYPLFKKSKSDDSFIRFSHFVSVSVLFVSLGLHT